VAAGSIWSVCSISRSALQEHQKNKNNNLTAAMQQETKQQSTTYLS